jgi:hypothetical protein
MSAITKKSLALACGVLLLACARDEPIEEQAIEEEPVAESAATISLADVAGTWNVLAVTEAGDSVPAFQLVVTADQSDWTMNAPNRPPIAVRVIAVDGDSIVTEAGPYESLLRSGVQVTTESVYRLEGDRLVSHTVAHFETTEPDSVVRVRAEGTRAP